VSLLADMHLRHLREKMMLKQRIDEVTRKVEVCVSVAAFVTYLWNG